MPKGYAKPGPNASNHEVTQFLTKKYVDKVWANHDDWSHDPAWLYENKPKKFQKYIQWYKDQFGGSAGSAPKPAEKKRADSSDDDTPAIKAKPAKQFAAPPGFKAPPAATV